MGRIINLFCIFALVSEICSAQEDPKKTEKLLDLAKQIVPGMKGQSLALGDILKALKVLKKSHFVFNLEICRTCLMY